jgi:uncharacterized protein
MGVARREVVRPAMVGAAAGFLSGLFGVGGGILIVPGLVMLLGMRQRRAHATSLAAILPIAVTGAAGYAVEGAVSLPAAGLLTLGAAVGALVGTRALRRVPERGLAAGFALFVLATAAALPFEVLAARSPAPLTVLAGIILVVVGLGSGMLAGLLGVGGGIVMVPALVLLLGMDHAVAKGTSLLVIIPTSVVGTVRNARAGDADLGVAAVVGVAGAALAFGGSFLSVRLSPLVSALLFGVLLVAVAVQMLIRARRRDEGTTATG